MYDERVCAPKSHAAGIYALSKSECANVTPFFFKVTWQHCFFCPRSHQKLCEPNPTSALSPADHRSQNSDLTPPEGPISSRKPSQSVAAMVASKKSFKIGDLVFAKVKGYPPWPAKVILRVAGRNDGFLFFFAFFPSPSWFLSSRVLETSTILSIFRLPKSRKASTMCTFTAPGKREYNPSWRIFSDWTASNSVSGHCDFSFTLVCCGMSEEVTQGGGKIKHRNLRWIPRLENNMGLNE